MFASINSSSKRGMAMAMEVKAMQDRARTRKNKEGSTTGTKSPKSSPANKANQQQKSEMKDSSKRHRTIFGTRKQQSANKQQHDTQQMERRESHTDSERTTSTSHSSSTKDSKTRQTKPTKSSVHPDTKMVQAEQTLKLIQDTIASQESRDDQLGQEIAALVQDAKMKMASGNKRGAIRQLKKMKLKQYEQNKVCHAIETMEAQVLTIISAMESAKVLKAMQQGANTMKSLQNGKDYSVEAFDSVVLDIKDTMDYADEIQQILAEPVSNVVMDEDELLKELAEVMESGSAPSPSPHQEITTTMDMDLPSVPPNTEGVLAPQGRQQVAKTCLI